MSLREPSAEASEAAQVLKLPCGRCIGCNVRQARDWAVRCCLEAAEHEETAFVTLTYDDDHLPERNLIQKGHLSGWLKRVRARLSPRRVRFFACGEYGETTKRPHYHALLFGVRDNPSLQSSWPFGFVRVDPCTPAAISYVAGYVGKKIGDPQWWPRTEEVFIRESERKLPKSKRERFRFLEDGDPPLLVSERTGEIVSSVGFRRVIWKVRDPHAAFRLMSRNPGIGGDSRDLVRHWRTSAIWRGREVPVPRYLHLAYKLAVTDEEYEQLSLEKREQMLQRDTSRERLLAGEAIAKSLQSIKQESRTL